MTRLNYQKRWYLLLAAGILMIGTLWKQRLQGSIELWRARDQLTAQLNAPDDRAERIAAARAQLVEMDRALGDPSIPPNEVWRSALSFAAIAANAKLHSVEEALRFDGNGKSRHVLPVTLQGGFTPLLQAANDLQQQVPEAQVASLRFHAEREPMTRKRQLFLTLYLQKLTDDNG